MSSLKQLAIKGAIWTLVGYGSSQVLRFLSNLILTRLLAPELFGFMALVNTFITGLNLFSDIGININIVRSSRGDEPEFLNTAWTIQVIRGILIWFICLLISYPLSLFYEKLELLWLIPIVGIGSCISGFTSTSLATFKRKLHIGQLVRFELITQIISLAIMIVWAYLIPNIWALVGSNLLSSIIRMLWSHSLDQSHRNTFSWNQDVIQEILTIGKWSFLNTALAFMTMEGDRLILGKLIPLGTLGIYIIAYTLAQVPTSTIYKLSDTIIFPIISKEITQSRSIFQKKFSDKRFILLLISSLLLSIGICFGDLFILTVYDQRYYDASWMITLLLSGLWQTILYRTVSPCLWALGRPKYIIVGNFVKLTTILIGLPLIYSYFGLFYTVVFISFYDFPAYIANNIGLFKENLNFIKQDLSMTFVFLTILAVILTIRYLLGFGIPLYSYLPL